MLENVEEFKTWGPLNRRHHPIKSKQGETFRKFVGQLKALGYVVDYRELVAAGLLKQYVGAYTQLDFSLPCPSIFDTAEEIKEKYGIRAVRPLAHKTMERIARGLKKFVLDNAEPTAYYQDRVVEQLKKEKEKGHYDSDSVIGEKNVWEKASDIVRKGGIDGKEEKQA